MLLLDYVFGVVLGVETDLPGLGHLLNIIMPTPLPNATTNRTK